MRTVAKILAATLMMFELSAGLLAEQDRAVGERPVPPMTAIATDETAAPVDESRPDTRPVTGTLPFTLGPSGIERSFFAPGFRVSQAVDTNPMITAGSPETLAITDLSGNVILQRVSSRDQLSLHYTGGGYIYGGHSDLNATYQGAELEQSFRFRRWSLTLADDVSYTPDAAFGYVGLAGVSGSDVGSAEKPNQSIFTARSRRLSNTVVGQMNYAIAPRSSVTISGNFGVLRAPDGVLLESDQGGIQVGYNHDLNPRNSLGVLYGFDRISYLDDLEGRVIDSHKVELAYGRKITGRLALQLSAGPQFDQFQDPLAGDLNYLGWTARSGLTYRFRKAELGLSYWHSLSDGAGILGGAKTDQIEGTLSTRLTRTLSALFSAGYAHNSALAETVGPLAEGAFNTEFVSAGVTKPVNHQASLFANYRYQHQTSNAAIENLDRHVFGIGFEWHMRPVLIR